MESGSGAVQRGMGDISFWADHTPVHEAVKEGEVFKLKQLIENGACVNLVTIDSITPLHEASLRGQIQCVQILLAAGAQVDARNIDGSTPLCDACAAGSIECVKLLLNYGATVNPLFFAASPLHEACMIGSAECMKLLIDVGANLEAYDCHFGTPLHVACARPHVDCAKLLLNAAKAKNVDLIQMLIDYGANVYAEDNRGKTPLRYTQSGSPSSACLEYYQRTPLSLSHYCRVTLRKALGPQRLHAIYQINIAPRLIGYLCYD
ncbi:ankyrin repeat and SOCS box protein 13-like isoform X2 [Scyliorhinus canicula]|uniref:ankyrin repeat and SOCS box protein 13-like isoform X2 n=1 Tax=Scyliorhinus canicula TaxID=7830 RepID=UPI0018F3C02D|nr:ankyrin repeat and SOCS box protein 13-like isoform X2 [Scyliorhinus canicula]